MATLKVPYLNLSGPDGQQVRRNFEEIHKFFDGFTVQFTTTAGNYTISKWRLGESPAHGSSWAELSNSLMWSGGPGNAGTFALLASNTGQTIVNAATGQRVYLRVNNTSTLDITANEVMMQGSRPLRWEAYGGGWFMSDTTWIRAYGDKNVWLGGGSYASDGKLSLGYGGGFEFESISVQGGNSGLSLKSRNTSARWVIYPIGNDLLVWDGSDGFRFESSAGAHRFQAGLGSSGASICGPWVAGANYTFYASLSRAQGSSAHYGMLIGTGDADMYLAAADTNGAIIYRFAYNGSTFMSTGINNRTMQALATIDMAIPALGGGNTVNVQANGSWQVGYVSSSREHKLNVRTLRDTPAPDSGADNPVFKFRPVRFNWKQDTRDARGHWQQDGVVNADRLNALHPDGVVGLLAEEVALVAPDAVIYSEGRDPEPWDPERHGLPPTDPETGEPVTHTRAWPKKVMGLDNDRLIAYLIDAVQHLESEIASLRGRP